MTKDGYGVVAVDFDGTISEYSGWKGPGNFGPPIKGCREALNRIRLKGYTIIINTTRGVDIYEVKEYLDEHDIPHDLININHTKAPANVSDKKILADVYIDDRALRFDGRWEGIPEQVDWFMPWYKRENKRPSLNLAVAGYHVDQVSLYVPDLEATKDEYQLMGHGNWVVDTVDAMVVKSNMKPSANDGHRFKVKLAFNYTMYPCEFELIQVLEGYTVQIPAKVTTPGLSHYGFHVEDLKKAVDTFARCGYKLMTHVRTQHHSGCPYTSEYVFMNTLKLGFISKLIWRAS